MKGWQSASALHAYEQLTMLGWRIPVRTYRRTMTVATALALVCLAGLGAVVFTLARSSAMLAIARADRPAVALISYLAACGYVVGIAVFRQSVTRRRDVVAASPHAPFFRTLDIPAVAVFTVWAATPILRSAAVYLVLAASYVFVFRPELSAVVSAPWALLALPLGIGALELALAARAATVLASGRRGARWIGLAVAALALLAAGRITTTAVDLSASHHMTWSRPPGTTTVLIAGTAVLTAGLCAAIVARSWRRLGSAPFAVVGSPPARRGPDRQCRTSAGWLATALLAGLVSGRSGRLRGRWWRAATLAAAAAVGLAPLVDGGLQEVVQRSAALIAYLSVLALAESGVQASGPTAMAAQLRTVYELGASRRSVTTALLGGLLVDALAVGCAVTAISATLTHQLDARPVLVALAAAGAVVLADSLLPGRVCADGSVTVSVGAAAVGVVLSAPVLALTALAGAAAGWRSWGAVFVVLAVLIGDVACIRQTLNSRPSTLPA